MEGVWGLFGLPAPAYVASLSHLHHSGDENALQPDCHRRQPDSSSTSSSSAAPQDDDVVYLGHIDDSLSSLLHEDTTLWMLRTMFECIEMTPNGSLFLTPPHELPHHKTPSPTPTEAEVRALRERVDRQIGRAVEDKRRAREAQNDLVALFGTAGLHEENILRAMGEEQRYTRNKVIKQRRTQRVAQFKDDLRRRIAADGQAFDDGMSEDLSILDRVFADSKEAPQECHAVGDATIAAVMVEPVEADGDTKREEGANPAADVFVQEESVSVKGAEGPESEDDDVESSRVCGYREPTTTKEAKGKEKTQEWEAVIAAALRAAHRGDFDEGKVIREHERRRARFGSELAQQMWNLEHKTDEMRRELQGVSGYAPFCPSCFRPVMAPCLCRALDDDDAALSTS
jgi:hypothetical protein